VIRKPEQRQPGSMKLDRPMQSQSQIQILPPNKKKQAAATTATSVSRRCRVCGKLGRSKQRPYQFKS